MALTASEIIGRFEQKEDTFRIRISDNTEEDIVVRNVTSVQEMSKVNKRAATLLRFTEKTAPAPMRAYVPMSPEVANIVAELTMLVITPKFSDVEALQLCQKSGPFAAFLHGQIMGRTLQSLPDTEAEALEDAKNASEPMLSGETT